MSRQSRLWRGLYGGCWLALLSVVVLCITRGTALPLLSDDVGGGRWWWLVLWLLLGGLLAIPRSDHQGWALIAALTGGLFFACGVLGLRVGASHAGIGAALSLFALGALCLWSAQRLLQWRPGKRRPPRHHRQPKPRGHARWGQSAFMLAWAAWSVAIVSSFLLAWQASLSNRDLFAAAAVVLLIVSFLALPAVGILYWWPRASALGLAISGLACASVPLPATAHTTTVLALVVASLAAWTTARSTSLIGARA